MDMKVISQLMEQKPAIIEKVNELMGYVHYQTVVAMPFKQHVCTAYFKNKENEIFILAQGKASCISIYQYDEALGDQHSIEQAEQNVQEALFTMVTGLCFFSSQQDKEDNKITNLTGMFDINYLVKPQILPKD